MKIMFDTNIILDLLLERKPFVDYAQDLFDKVESGKIDGYLGATTITTLDYLLTKSLPSKEAKKIIKTLLKLFEIAPVNRLILEDALDAGFLDFEDAVLHSAAIHCGVQAIVTRDEKGFSKAQLAIYSPEALLTVIPSD
ncbi:MAG: twitching motility protein PilT [Gammaproteobacteria bacterium RIFCSPHIGHO2_12_FULL_38_11]|nr:MAG: twitching motility protein PilT [Gammaproteobacteria bacterium RIFCSPHIGHO2_12_FULL_38_11]